MDPMLGGKVEEGKQGFAIFRQDRLLVFGAEFQLEAKGIIFVLHNLRDTFEVADRVVVPRRGENAGERKLSETTSDEIVRMMVGK
jgi:simple sugar transport system ATP-binding protein